MAEIALTAILLYGENQVLQVSDDGLLENYYCTSRASYTYYHMKDVAFLN
jgi:hypothetical protein